MLTLRQKHIFRVISYFCIGMAVLALLQSRLNASPPPQNAFEYLVSFGFIFLLPNLIPCALGTVGLLLYSPSLGLENVRPMCSKVIFRIVSKGDNKETLVSTIKRCRDEMKRTPLFNYHIEVVVEEKSFFEMDSSSDITIIRVPTKYQTSNRTQYKARALHYALLHSRTLDTDWTVYLDEETQPTISGIKGICRMISEEEASGKLRVGQGAIIYHRNLKKFPFLTLADMVRTGDDIGRFYLQQFLGKPYFGLHGSFIVARNDVVKSTGGFDVGQHGHITEDAYWAMLLIKQKIKTRWVDGYMEEQSTQSVSDFTRQRARWFKGVSKVVRNVPVNLAYRIPLAFLLFAWSAAPLGFAYGVINGFWGIKLPLAVQIPINFGVVYIVCIYIIGLEENLKEREEILTGQKLKWKFLVILLLPLFTLLEVCGVLRGMFSVQKGFHVVKK